MSKLVLIPDEVIIIKIYLLRDKKVMVDLDLAELYSVSTKHLKPAVRRKINRFPEDFIFKMILEELGNRRTKFAISNSDKMSLCYLQ